MVHLELTDSSRSASDCLEHCSHFAVDTARSEQKIREAASERSSERDPSGDDGAAQEALEPLVDLLGVLQPAADALGLSIVCIDFRCYEAVDFRFPWQLEHRRRGYRYFEYFSKADLLHLAGHDVVESKATDLQRVQRGAVQ